MDDDLVQVVLQYEHLRRSAAAAAATALFVMQDRVEKKNRRGRTPNSKTIIRGLSPWIHDYLGEFPVFSRRFFRAQFRIPRGLFEKVHRDLVERFKVFQTRRNAAKKVGIQSEVKVLACLQVLGSGCAIENLDESSQMSRESIRAYLKKFCVALIEMYGDDYLNRRPSPKELQDIQKKYEAKGFPGCIGAVDCCRLQWKNCPHSWKKQYYNPTKGNLATISVEAWCDSDLYFWNWFVGPRGTNNDSIMVSISPLFTDIRSAKFDLNLEEGYTLEGSNQERKLPYFLVNANYPKWPIFAKPIHYPANDEEQIYTNAQEAVRKDTERAFSVIQTRFKILQKESFYWYERDIMNMNFACIILHNMIVRLNEQGAFKEDEEEEDDSFNMVTELYDDEQKAANGHAESDYPPMEMWNAASPESNPDDMDTEEGEQEGLLTSEIAFRSLQQDLVRALGLRRTQ